MGCSQRVQGATAREREVEGNAAGQGGLSHSRYVHALLGQCTAGHHVYSTQRARSQLCD